MKTSNLPYDISDRNSIYNYALRLKDKSLYDLYSSELDNLSDSQNKGNLGNLLEKLFFKYEPNNRSEPDFKEADLELKTSPIKKLKNGEYVPKERLVLNNINFFNIVETDFLNSSFINKNKNLLLMFYEHQKDIPKVRMPFKIVKLWELSTNDLDVIKKDWSKIKKKVIEGKAHELSSGDTFYLEACRKGAGGLVDLTNQPNSNKKAYKRAYALKQKYLKFILKEDLAILQSILKEDYEGSHSIEEYIVNKFKPYYGMSFEDLKSNLSLDISNKAKNASYLIACSILGINEGKKIEEFEKGNIKLKTITIENDGKLKESMSFKQIDYKNILNEKWEESYVYNEIVSPKYFFVIFKKDNIGKKILKKVIFWNMPVKAEQMAYKYWFSIKENISKKDFENFWKISDENIFHVRPKALNASDLFEMEDGTKVKKFCYWINSRYIRENILNNI